MFSPRFTRLIPRSFKIARFAKAAKKQETAPRNSDGESVSEPASSTPEDINELGIPMISSELHARLFDICNPEKNANNSTIDGVTLKNIRNRIAAAAGIDVKNLSNVADDLDNVALDVPELTARSIDDHFWGIAEEQVRAYRELATKLASIKMPTMPTKTQWIMKSGWTKYGQNGTPISVDFPEEDALVLDVEVSQSGKKPTLAIALSENSWYSWCSEELCRKGNGAGQYFEKKELHLKDLIPLETKNGQTTGFERRKKLVIGHNVAFDRSYVKEQYFLEKTDLRFLDTMSMHIATSGFAHIQRSKFLKQERLRKESVVVTGENGDEASEQDSEWEKKGSMNSLLAVHNHYCPNSDLAVNKQGRDVFIEGTLDDVRDKFADSMEYCAQDVVATFEVFSKLLPDFLDRFQHPVTLSGVLEMGTAYLPINGSWFHFINAAEESCNARTDTVTKLLVTLANEAVGLLKDDKYRDDPWLWDEDWSVYAKAGYYKKSTKRSDARTGVDAEERVKQVWDAFAERTRKAQPYLPRFPKWYTELCKRPTPKSESLDEALKVAPSADVSDKWGPQHLTLQMRIAPKLLRMHYNGYPLYHHSKHGWGYLVPDENEKPLDGFEKESDGHDRVKSNKIFPLRRIKEVIAEHRQLLDIKKMKQDASDGESFPCDLPGVNFYKLPHKNGFSFNVGNPFAKDFLHLIEEGKLMSHNPEHALHLANVNRVCSYWKITRDRIMEQMAVLFYQIDPTGKQVTAEANQENGDLICGAIVPRVITSGTVTRRAVEPLWMTASNAKEKRIGSEVKSMVQAPPGYVFVGADVDSQELWIAALLGDSWKFKMHGCTPFSWMLLRGNKSDGTDQHSMVAKELGVTRDQAKVLNYGRIYGAGLPFATVLLKQFRPNQDVEEIQALAKRLYLKTKGYRRKYCSLTELGATEMARGGALVDRTDRMEYFKVKKAFSERHINVDDDQYCAKVWQEWENGTESEVFNRLERIALSDTAATPVSGCRLSRALELGSDNKGFLPSRVNWVVQSSAVDYLHLMLVSMRWLFDKYKIQGRFSISIHDEVRYLVAEEDKYRAALALQITNLLTRAMFVSKMGMSGLPRSVAFFNKVDIDKALRKEVYMDATTPSNKLGLRGCYGVPPGDALDIRQIIERTGGGRLDKA